MDISLQVNAAGDPVETFRNEEASGWMKLDDWQIWRTWMSGGSDDRGKGRRHKPAFNARAAALITGAERDQADEIASAVYREQQARWRAKHGFGQVAYQFMAHLPIQHYVGTIALSFIPYIGPFLSAAAQQATPMVEAASKEAIARHEATRVSEAYRADYYEAMDAWLRGGPEPPVEYLEYHATVVVPAALDVRDQLASGVLDTATGSYPLTKGGWELWSAQNEDYRLPVIGGFRSKLARARVFLAEEIRSNPGPVMAAVVVGVLSGITTHLLMRRE